MIYSNLKHKSCCPDILGSVQVNCFVNNDQLTLATFYNSSKSNQTLQFCFGSYSDHNGGRSCSKSIKMKDVSNSIYLGRIPEDALKVQVIDKMYKFSIIYLFYSFSLFKYNACYLMKFILGFRVAKTRQLFWYLWLFQTFLSQLSNCIKFSVFSEYVTMSPRTLFFPSVHPSVGQCVTVMERKLRLT